MLPEPILRWVAGKVDHDTRVRCCLASRQLSRILCADTACGVWDTVEVYEPTPAAARFVERVTCVDVTVRGSAEGVHTWLKSLDAPLVLLKVVLDGPCSDDLGHTVAKFPLVRLVVEFPVEPPHGPHEPSGLVFDADLPFLRTLIIKDPTQTCEVYVECALERLRHLDLRVGESNALATRMPSLGTLQYRVARETFEDAVLESSNLTSFGVLVMSDAAWVHLQSALKKASSIDSLYIETTVSLTFDEYIRVRHLDLLVCSSGLTIELSVPHVRSAVAITTQGKGGVRGWSVVVSRCGTWTSFERFQKNTHLTLNAPEVIIEM